MPRPTQGQVLVIASLFILLAVLNVDGSRTLRPRSLDETRANNNNSPAATTPPSTLSNSNNQNENTVNLSSDQVDQFSEMDDRMQVREPYKTLLTSAARFALAQTNVTRYVKIDLAMDLLGELAYTLSKPSTLIRVVKVGSMGVASMVVTFFLFPNAYQLLDRTWQRRMDGLNLDRYLSNGISERSVVDMLGSQTDQALRSIGFEDENCRELTMCYVGLLTQCSFPDTSGRLTKLFTDSLFANVDYKDHAYVRAFMSGFRDKNCSSESSNGNQQQQPQLPLQQGHQRQSHQACLTKLIESIILSPRQAARRNG